MAAETVQMKVSGLMCSFCTMSVEKALKRYDGVKSVMVNLVHGIVLVEADTSRITREELAAAVEKLGYDVAASEVQQFATDEGLHTLIRKRGTIGMTLAIADLLVAPLNIFAVSSTVRGWISFAVAAFVLLWVGYPILRKTILAVRQRVINANVLLSTAAWGSFAVGTASLFDPRWPHFLPVAAWLMALHLFFGFFKLDVRKKAAEAVRKLLALQPPRARVLRGEQELEVRTGDIAVGELVVVRPGEHIPLDGKVIDGTASVDESSFTGESVPATKQVGADVIGGTLNLDGLLRVRVTKVGSERFLSQIVRLMTQIAERKPPIELLADRLMNYYGPVVFTVAAIAFVVWLIASGNWIGSALVLLTVIIMGYPCALGISTPMLAAIAGGKGISIGLLVKATEVFHGLSLVDTVVLDKTGTLTHGRPTVTDLAPFGIDRMDLLALAGSVERSSEHPLGQAINFFAEREGAPSVASREFRAIPGKGVAAFVNGAEIVAGKPSFIAERNVPMTPEAYQAVDRLSADGKTVVVIARGQTVVGAIALQDQPRRSAERLIAKLRAAGIRTVMLTGDSQPVARAIGMRLGIDDVRAELLPADKVAAIEALQKESRHVAMVGDGINDAPALAQADVGIAIGAGTDVAIESAGVILIGDRLKDVVNALTLGKAAYGTLKVNVAIAVLFNIIGMILAAMGLITPLLAVGWMILSIIAIFLSTLRVRMLPLERHEVGESVPLAEIEFAVPNMVCEGCAEKITAALRAVPGVREVKPKVPQKHVMVRFEPTRVNEPQLKNVVGQAGFTAVEI
jgi:heavy metal translocating P-type ATPase